MPDLLQPVGTNEVTLQEENRTRRINIEQLRTAQGTLRKYQSGKANYEKIIKNGEDWWKLQHFRGPFQKLFKDEKTGEMYPATDHPRIVHQSAWMWNSIMNKHADLMDNFPDPVVKAKEESDEPTAKMLESIIPVILDNCKFETTYNINSFDKLKFGTAVYGVVWNPELHNGIGDIEVRQVDVLSIYWEPGVEDIQDSRNIFILTAVDKTVLGTMFPQTKDRLTGTAAEKVEYNYTDPVDNSDKAIVVDWYYKTQVMTEDGSMRTILNYVKYVQDIVLYSSEDDDKHPEYREYGYYYHGRYPFVFDVAYPEKGSPAGFGYVDIMRNAQEAIDNLSADILENARFGAKPRYFFRDDSGVNQMEFQDPDQQIVHIAGSIDDNRMRPIEHKPLDTNYLNVRQAMIDELKETSGNRDFSQGATSGGVTAASAVAALQEAGAKGSRALTKGSYRAFTEICELVIELIRQFYDEPRTFRIMGESGQTKYVQFDNSGLQSVTQNVGGIDFKTKEPGFDIKVKAQKSNPYSRMSQNELALQFYGNGFFNPDNTTQALACLDMMDFDGKDKVIQQVQQNGTIYEQLQQQMQVSLQLAQLLADQTGEARPLQALMAQQGMAAPQPSVGGMPADMSRDSFGQPFAGGSTQADKARRQSQQATEVRS